MKAKDPYWQDIKYDLWLFVPWIIAVAIFLKIILNSGGTFLFCGLLTLAIIINKIYRDAKAGEFYRRKKLKYKTTIRGEK